VAVRACFSFALFALALRPRYLPTTRLTTMAAMPASTALAIGDDTREFTDAGGLMSYGGDMTDAYRLTGDSLAPRRPMTLRLVWPRSTRA
jgi:hypothetical protein